MYKEHASQQQQQQQQQTQARSSHTMYQDVVALNHNNGGERGNTLELDQLLVCRIVNVDPAIHTSTHHTSHITHHQRRRCHPQVYITHDIYPMAPFPLSVCLYSYW
jgi:hypothetical protein